MGYFDGMVEQYFGKEDQSTVFYPWGKFGRGRIFDSDEQAQTVRRFVKRYLTIQWIALLISIEAGVIWGFTQLEFQGPYMLLEAPLGVLFATLLFQCVSIPLWIYYLRVYRINELKVAAKKFSWFQSMLNAAPSYGASTIWVLIVLNVIMLAAGILAMVVTLTSELFSRLNVLIIIFSLIFFGFTLFMWLSMLRKSKQKNN